MKKLKKRLSALLLALVVAVLPLFIAAPSYAANADNLADPTSSDWLNDYRMSMKSAVYACAGALVTNYIAVKPGDVVRVTGLDMVSYPTNYGGTPKSGMYDADKNELLVNVAASGGTYWSYVQESDHVAAITVLSQDAAYMRFCGEPYDGYSADDIVITVEHAVVYDPTDALSGAGGVFSVFSGVGSWLAGAVNNMVTMFWTAEGGLSVLGVLAVVSLAVAFILLLICLVAGWLKFR